MKEFQQNDKFELEPTNSLRKYTTCTNVKVTAVSVWLQKSLSFLNEIFYRNELQK